MNYLCAFVLRLAAAEAYGLAVHYEFDPEVACSWLDLSGMLEEAAEELDPT